MKTYFYPFVVLLSLIIVSCDDFLSETITYRINEPIFMDVATFRNSVKIKQDSHEITGYGKISFYKDYLYMSEPDKGIHIIDNSNPANPHVVGYIELMGNADISVRNDILYADSYIDLVWFDVKNPAQPEYKGRLENVFPDAIPFVTNEFGVDYELSNEGRKTNKVIVGWKEVERTESVKRSDGKFWLWNWGKKDDLVFDGNLENNTGSGSQSLNGSMSRFSIYQKYLYVVLKNQMQVFDLSKPLPERVAENLPVGFNVETIFNYKEYMYMGTPTGMLIYSVEDPINPVYKSSITHAFGCDPVVVADDIAYVTVRAGNECGQENNELIIIDVKDASNPKKLVTYTMTGPKGLGIDNKTLFICDDGLKIFDATNVYTIMANQLAHFKNMAGYDVIPYNNLLMMIAEDGIHQYDYSDLNKIEEIGYLRVK